MRPVLSTAFCVALLAAAAAAFALTEGAKTELSPLYGTHVDKVFSPIACCGRHSARIDFVLRHPERLEVWVLHGGKRVQTIVSGRHYGKGPVRLAFDGRAADGAVFPNGAYFPVVRLLGDHRTFALPNEILLDTHPPRVVAHSRVDKLIAPGSVGAPHRVSVRYVLSAAGHGVLFADGHRVAETFRQRLRGTLEWAGQIHGRLVAPGTYTLEIAVEDQAGNRSIPRWAGQVTVRYLELAPSQVRVRPRERFELGVVIGPPRLSVVFAGKRLTTSARTLRLRAPARRGRYQVYVDGAGHGAAALVIVA